MLLARVPAENADGRQPEKGDGDGEEDPAPSLELLDHGSVMPGDPPHAEGQGVDHEEMPLWGPGVRGVDARFFHPKHEEE